MTQQSDYALRLTILSLACELSEHEDFIKDTDDLLETAEKMMSFITKGGETKANVATLGVVH